MKKTRLFAYFFPFKLLKNLKKNVIIFRYETHAERQGNILGKQNHRKVKTKEMKRESLLVTKESFCATFAMFSFLAILISCTGPYIFGDFGVEIYSFFAGVFGYFAYPLLLGMIYLSVTGLFGKRFVKNRRVMTSVSLTLICMVLLAHAATTFTWAREDYLAKCLSASDVFPNATVAGLLGGAIVYAMLTVMSNVGTIVLLSLFVLFFIYLTYLNVKYPVQPKEKKVKTETVKESVQPETPSASPVEKVEMPIAPQRTMSEPTVQNVNAYSPFGRMEEVKTESDPVREPQTSREILFGGDPIENFKKNGMFDPNSRANNRTVEPIVTPTASTFVPSYTKAYEDDINEDDSSYRLSAAVTPVEEPKHEENIEPLEYIEEPTAYQEPSYLDTDTPAVEQPREEYLNIDKVELSEPTVEEVEERPYRRHDYMDLFSTENPRLLEEMGDIPARKDDFTIRGFGMDEAPTPTDRGDRNFEREEFLNVREEDSRLGPDVFDDDNYTLDTRSLSPREEEMDISERGSNNTPASYLGLTDRDSRGFGRNGSILPKSEPTPEVPKKPRVIRPYKRVSLDDFDCRDIEPSQNAEEVEETKANIIATLEEFKVTGATIASVTFGPTVTRYNVALPRSVSPRKILSLDQSIAISLHSSGVSIYPNYEDGVVSIEVPNKERQFVQLGCMLSGNTFVNAPNGSLMFAMGKNVANAKVYGDISKMIHLLVAGSSGSGKSVFLGALIVSMIYKYSPEELRLILIDPKKTEFVLYNNLPHLMINEIITDVNKAVQSLNWAIGEMNRRYTLFEQMSRSGKYVVNLDQYNEQLEKNERLPKIVIIIDELADLMLAAKKDIEDKIQNLTQKARAAGIHLIVATQRPSADVITGVIKSNLSTRIAFAVASEVDSRVILDQSGAQKLLGKGDFLYSMPGINIPVRVQSAFISPADSQKVVNFIKENNEAYYDEEATAYINNTRTGGDDSPSADKDNFDPMCIEALRHVILSGSASISMIQRKCSVGYNRAGNIIEWMEDNHYISPFDGAKARKVLISKEQFESEFGPL